MPQAEVHITEEAIQVSKKINIVKAIILGVACLFLAIYLGSFVSSIFSSQGSIPGSVESYGPLTIIECSKCNEKIEKRCKDISREKCPKCSAPMLMAMECMKCGKGFADKKQYYDVEDGLIKCPYCKSKDTAFASKLKH